MFGLGSAFYLILFITNALAVLSEDRFLARVGWSSHSIQSSSQFDPHQGFGSSSQSNPYAANSDNVTIKARLINLISAVRTLMRIPLVVINIVVVVYLIVLG
ncbi:related to YOS1, subunit of the Yip1p-Yif1p Complex, required for Transport between the ER and the Golgi Complex [Ustilago trichophora]|uniref:Related to YOS1, subunit of the Yip1p-Yif1p Complex, required for Transport between the ER and the Golgi Complex n=1 Tax=Ustilago trichophora TaxID=86804 RepID=A0A5C3EKA0_9BASI|nr:related to YOS1, subunit of the Yip1p-Yif1p Complex, required for Transport between the ER and the Golgi Complex [Ustilago trichophora]